MNESVTRKNQAECHKCEETSPQLGEGHGGDGNKSACMVGAKIKEVAVTTLTSFVVVVVASSSCLTQTPQDVLLWRTFSRGWMTSSTARSCQQ